jgi:glycolate oxidase FAD binding subunit
VTDVIETEAGGADAIREAVASGTPIELTAGGTRRGLGRPVQAAKTVSLAGLTGVTLYEPGEQTLVVQAGVTIASIRDMLDAENQQLGFEPPDHRALFGSTGEPTIGGAIAVAASGPRRLRAGAARDALLGMRFVNGAGEVLRSGGRVMKNVTGYDLPKLHCGAYGTLGAITEIGLRVVPKIEVEKTLGIAGLSDAAAVAAMAEALKTPTDITAAAHLPASVARELGFADAMTLLRVEGFETQAAYRMASLRDALAGHELAEVESDPWPAIRDVMMFAGDDRAVWRISTRPTDAPALVATLSESMACEAFYDWAGGLIWLACAEGDDAHNAAVRATLAPYGGHATLIRASDTTRAAVPVFQPESAPIAALTRRIKDTFDPKGILNPGRMRG